MTTPEGSSFARFDPYRVPSPCYVLDLERLELNLSRLAGIRKQTGARILLALKAFSCFAVAGLIDRYLDGTAASGNFEARLAKTRFGGEVHTYAPGLKHDHLEDVLAWSDHLIFNSIHQWQRFEERLRGSRGCEFGLRINPGHREVENPLYDPCGPWSRLGVNPSTIDPESFQPFSGLHVHALCDHGYEPFARLLTAVESTLGHLFPMVEWINLGGGVLMTEDGFPRDRLAQLIRGFRDRTGLSVYLEPGTAVVLNAGALVTEVLDVERGDGNTAILDASATCHMPDVIEAHYTPDLLGAEALPRDGASEAEVGDDPSVWRLGGPTCLAGDIIGTYRMNVAPSPGDRLVLLDLAYYTMVKSTTFNGTPLPSIALWDPRTNDVSVIRTFDYDDFEHRLG